MDADAAVAQLSSALKALPKVSGEDAEALQQARNTAFTSVSALLHLIRTAAEPEALATNPCGPPWIDAARMALEEAVTSKHLQPATMLRELLRRSLPPLFCFASVAHHLYGTVKELQAIAAGKAVPPLTRAAIVAVLGELFALHGSKLASVAGDSVALVAKYLTIKNLSVRIAALRALHGTIIGASPLSATTTSEAVKVVQNAAKDKVAEARTLAGQCLGSLAEAAANGVGPSTRGAHAGFVPLETTLTLCVKGLDDAATSVKLSFANAMARVLHVAIEDQAKQDALREQNAARAAKMEAAEDKAAQEQSRGTFDKQFAKLKEMRPSKSDGGCSLLFTALLRAQTLPAPLIVPSQKKDVAVSFTLKSAVGHLCVLFNRAGTRQQRAGTAAALISLLQLQRANLDFGVNGWILDSLLGLVTNPRWNAADGVGACATVAGILRRGIAQMSSELQQLRLVAALVRKLRSMQDMNEWQLQIVLQEVSHLSACLGEALAPQASAIRVAVWTALDHREYAVRFEAATAIAALLQALPGQGPGVLKLAVQEARTRYSGLLSLVSSGGSGSARVNPREPDRKAHMYALHGRATVVALSMQGVKDLAGGLPSEVTDAALALADDLVSKQFDASLHSREAMGVLCTCVRAGWTLIGALLHQGVRWVALHLAHLLDLWMNAVNAVGKQHELGFEPTHELVCLDAALGCLLGLIRGYPCVFYEEPVVLTLTVEVLDRALRSVGPDGNLLLDPSVRASKQGRFRLKLVSTVIMEAFAWLPPGSFPVQVDTLCRWAGETVVALLGGFHEEEVLETTLTASMLDPSDSTLDMISVHGATHAAIPLSSAPTASHTATASASVGAAEAVVAVMVDLGAAPLDSIERELAVHPPSRAAAGGGTSPPPTPLHGPNWRAPPAPCPRIDIRLLDAAILNLAATFSSQDHAAQASTMQTLMALLLDHSTAPTGISSVLSSDDDRRRKDQRNRAMSLNVVTAILAIARALAPYAESAYNLDVEWVKVAHDILVALLRSPWSTVRRAAGEALALLAQKMGTVFQAHLLQELVAMLHTQDGRPVGLGASFTGNSVSAVSASVAGGLGTGSVPAGLIGGVGVASSSGGSGGVVAGGPVAGSGGGSVASDGGTNIRMGLMFALACLKRSVPALEAGGFWGELEAQLSLGDTSLSQVFRTWGFHSLTIVATTLDLGLTHQSRMRGMLSQMVGLLENHLLGPWGSTGAPGDIYEPAYLVAMIRLTNALMPIVQTFEPTQAVVARFLTLCQAIAQVLPSHEDPRVQCEALGTVQLLAAFHAKGFCSRSVLETLLGTLQTPLETSGPCLLASLGCLDQLVRQEPDVVAQRPVASALVVCLERLFSAEAYGGAPVWRGLAAPRSAEETVSSRLQVAEVAMRLLVQICVADCTRRPPRPQRVVHWLLLGRCLIVGGSVFAEGASIDTAEEGEDGEEVGTGAVRAVAHRTTTSSPSSVGTMARGSVTLIGTSASSGESSTGDNDTMTVKPSCANAAGLVSDYKAVVEVSRQRANIAASVVVDALGTGSLRWQVRRALTDCMREGLARAAAAPCAAHHWDVAAARQAVQEHIGSRHGGMLSFTEALTLDDSSDGALLDFAALHVDTLVGTACSAAASTVAGEHRLVALQIAGLSLLALIVDLLGRSLDPDVEGAPARILEQFTSQMNSAFRASLAAPGHPALVRVGTDVLLRLAGCGLISDPVRVKRLLKTLLPACLSTTSLRPSPNPDALAFVPYDDQIVRIATVAELFLLCASSVEASVDSRARLHGRGTAEHSVSDSNGAQSIISLAVAREVLATVNNSASGLLVRWCAFVLDANRVFPEDGADTSSDCIGPCLLRPRAAGRATSDTYPELANRWPVVAAAALRLMRYGAPAQQENAASLSEAHALTAFVCGEAALTLLLHPPSPNKEQHMSTGRVFAQEAAFDTLADLLRVSGSLVAATSAPHIVHEMRAEARMSSSFQSEILDARSRYQDYKELLRLVLVRAASCCQDAATPVKVAASALGFIEACAEAQGHRDLLEAPVEADADSAWENLIAASVPVGHVSFDEARHADHEDMSCSSSPSALWCLAVRVWQTFAAQCPSSRNGFVIPALLSVTLRGLNVLAPADDEACAGKAQHAAKLVDKHPDAVAFRLVENSGILHLLTNLAERASTNEVAAEALRSVTRSIANEAIRPSCNVGRRQTWLEAWKAVQHGSGGLHVPSFDLLLAVAARKSESVALRLDVIKAMHSLAATRSSGAEITAVGAAAATLLAISADSLMTERAVNDGEQRSVGLASFKAVLAFFSWVPAGEPQAQFLRMLVPLVVAFLPLTDGAERAILGEMLLYLAKEASSAFKQQIQSLSHAQQGILREAMQQSVLSRYTKKQASRPPQTPGYLGRIEISQYQSDADEVSSK